MKEDTKMKKIHAILAAAAAFAMLFSCAKEENAPQSNNDKSEISVPGEVTPGDGIHTLTLTAPQTRTEFGEGSGTPKAYPKYWTAGDVINVNGKDSDPLAAGDAGSSTATFHFSEDISGSSYQVVYPADRYNKSTGKVTIPAAQTYSVGKFDAAADIILGYGTDPAAITLSNAVAYLKIRLTKGSYGNFGVKNIAVTSAGKKLCGEFDIDGTGLALTVPASSADAAEETVTLSTGGQLLGDIATEFLIAVAPQTCDIAVTITDAKDNAQTKNKAGAVLAKGGLLAQPAFGFDEYHAITTPADLLAFAHSCSAGNSNYWVITANIDMDGKTWPAAGTGDAAGTAFNGTLDGGNNGTENGAYKISNLKSTTGAFINFAYSSSTIKNLTLDSSCEISFSGAITENYKCMGPIGMTRGAVQHVYNRASVTCTSTSRTKNLFMGGIVGRQYRMGSISNCYNFGQVYSNVTLSCTKDTKNEGDDYIGGITGMLDRASADDNATINNCSNSGVVKASGTSSSSYTHIGGVVGQINTRNGISTKLEVTGLVNTGDVIVENNDTRFNTVYVLAGGVVGGIHYSSTASSGSGEVVVKSSHVADCQISNGDFNNTTGYGEAAHTGGFVGLARGGSITFSDNCYVSNVDVATRRGFGGGFVGYGRSATFDGCRVLGCSVKGSLAQLWAGGGIAGVAYGSTIKDCVVTLNKDTQYNLYTSTTWLYSGGIAGKTQGTSSISGCKAYVKRMYQATDTPLMRGWIVGYIEDGTTTIKDCGLGGTYGNNADTYTLVDDSEADYYYANKIYGSVKDGATVSVTGTNYLWDGVVTP